VPTGTTEVLSHITQVLKDTHTPTWLKVTKDYTKYNAGTIKADEWRTLSTVHLPIALITLWGDHDGQAPAKDDYLFLVLCHTMALFQAVRICCSLVMTRTRAEAYRDLIQEWVSDLHKLHPHTREHRERTNIHALFHVYDFMNLFGPAISWWTFPFERLIGTLQKINTNDHVGGEHIPAFSF
jgi:hypothetical protein